MSEEFSLWTIVSNWSPNISDSSEVSLIQKISLSTSVENISNIIKSWKSSRKTSPRNALNFSKKSVRTLRTSKSSMNNSARTLSSVSTKIQATDKNSLNSWDIIPQNPEKTWSVLKNTLLAWNKVKKISISLLEIQELQLLLLLLLRPSKREISKLFTWLTPLMSMLFNNLKTFMDINLKTAPKKVSNSTKLKMRKRNSKNKKLLSKVFANSSRKFWETKSRRFKLVKGFTNHPALWLLENTDGQQTWRESWKLKPWEIHLCLTTWSPKRLWKLMLNTPSWLNLKRNLMPIAVTKLSET